MTRRAAFKAARAFGRLSLVRKDSDGTHDGPLVRRARQILEHRRKRTDMFGRDLFGEPGWEIMLATYIGEQHDGGQTITNLTELSGVRPSVALRWLNVLISEGHIERIAHSTSPDRMRVQLTRTARGALERYLAETIVGSN